MESIKTNISRVGNFTSSEIVALTALATDRISFGKPAWTYIEECNMERRLGRSLNEEGSAKPLAWGTVGEKRVFDILPTKYRLTSNVTLINPLANCHVGSPDGDIKSEDVTAEIKCPMTLKSFCNLVDPIYNGLSGMEAMERIREKHKDGDKFYWQIVSNSILQGTKFGELIVYMPYRSELQSIRDLAGEIDDQNLYKYYWIVNSNDDELPFLLEDGFYKNINTIRFEIPEKDKTFLMARIYMAGKLLYKPIVK